MPPTLVLPTSAGCFAALRLEPNEGGARHATPCGGRHPWPPEKLAAGLASELLLGIPLIAQPCSGARQTDCQDHSPKRLLTLPKRDEQRRPSREDDDDCA